MKKNIWEDKKNSNHHYSYSSFIFNKNLHIVLLYTLKYPYIHNIFKNEVKNQVLEQIFDNTTILDRFGSNEKKLSLQIDNLNILFF